MNSKQSPKLPRLSSHTQTFQILMQSQGLKTLDEFKPQTPKRKSQLPVKANIFAHILQNMLISSSPGETDNFIAKIKPRADGKSGYRLNISTKQLNLSDIDPELFKSYFSQKNAHNLGALTAFNLICSGHLVPDNLFITLSPASGHFYFSQSFHEFWADFFDDFTHHVHIASHHSEQDKFMFFIPRDVSWWDVALENYQVSFLKRLFLNEFFKVYLRLSLTPFSLIETIMNKLFEHEDKTEVSSFISYVKDRINWVFRNFDSFWNIREKAQLRQFMIDQGLEELDKYLQDLDTYFVELEIIPPDYYPNMRLDIVAQAMELGIPDLDHLCHGSGFSDYQANIKIACFNYIISRIEIEKQTVLVTPMHHYWLILEEISANLRSGTHEFKHIDISIFLIHLFNKAIQFHKNNVALLLLTKNERLKNLGIRECLDNEPEIENLLERTPSTVALYYQNSIMLSALIAHQAKLSELDIIFLKEKLKTAVMTQQSDFFNFIIQYFSPILQHQDFERELIILCERYAPTFLLSLSIPAPIIPPPPPEVPRPRMRRQSFSFNTSQSLSGINAEELNALLTPRTGRK